MGCFFVWRVKKFILICCVFQSHGSIHCIHYNRFGFEPTNMPSQPLRVAVLHRFGFAAKIDKQLSIFLLPASVGLSLRSIHRLRFRPYERHTGVVHLTGLTSNRLLWLLRWL